VGSWHWHWHRASSELLPKLLINGRGSFAGVTALMATTAVMHRCLPTKLCTLRWVMQDPSRLAFGGGSFAGVTALMAAMRLPHVFGSVLVESPSLWTGKGRFLQVNPYFRSLLFTLF
jgi:hypothetical protein